MALDHYLALRKSLEVKITNVGRHNGSYRQIQCLIEVAVEHPSITAHGEGGSTHDIVNGHRIESLLE